jgi:two-component system OmpR family sensor kinase
VQALSNLVENALRVTPSNGRVTVHAQPGSLSVRDTGPGIAGDDLARAFERFYLYERYRSERAVGSGLGLTIVSELAQQMGGTIRVESAPQAGTEFTLTLPVGDPGSSGIAGSTDAD